MPSPDVRVRVRPAVVRVRVSETAVRTVVRVTTKQQDFSISTPVFLNYIIFAIICKPSPDVRVRVRPSVARGRASETAERTAVRETTKQQDLSSSVCIVVVTMAVNAVATNCCRQDVEICSPQQFLNIT